MLLIYGAYDERVSPYESLDVIKAALRAGGWPRHEPDYAGLMINWIAAQVGY